jgi:integrase
MKDKRTVLELPLSPRVGTILDRYIAVERRELLQGRDHDALWVTSNGDMLGRSGLELMIARRSKARFGIGFGPHRFRTSLTTTRAVAGGKHPFDASLILCHSPTTSLRYYNRADGLEASRAHDERIAALEDGDNPALAPWRVSPAIQKLPIRQAVPLRKSAANRKAAT